MFVSTSRITSHQRIRRDLPNFTKGSVPASINWYVFDLLIAKYSATSPTVRNRRSAWSSVFVLPRLIGIAPSVSKVDHFDPIKSQVSGMPHFCQLRDLV
jgi:hypothetical protein